MSKRSYPDNAALRQPDIVDQLQSAHEDLLGEAYERSIFLTAMREIQRLRVPAQRAAEPLDHIGDANDMVAQCLVSDWLAMFDPPPQIDFQQSDLLQQAISHALRKAASSVTSTEGK